jgi:hypothetical protein
MNALVLGRRGEQRVYEILVREIRDCLRIEARHLFELIAVHAHSERAVFGVDLRRVDRHQVTSVAEPARCLDDEIPHTPGEGVEDDAVELADRAIAAIPDLYGAGRKRSANPFRTQVT